MAIEQRIAEGKVPNGKLLTEEKFTSDKQALDYVAGKIAAEAKRQGIPLSEIERKMLYFSETDWTLPGILEVNAEFERDYDEDEYERKICSLGQAIEAQLKNVSAEESDLWYEAIQKLSDGDHYLLTVRKSATFFCMPRLKDYLGQIPTGATLIFDATHADHIDHDVREVVASYTAAATANGIRVDFKHWPAH